jgi:small subunit ribosomal protein S19
MVRSITKGPYLHPSLVTNFKNKKKPIKLWARNTFIVPQFVGLPFLVHNGKTFLRFLVTEEMVGHKFGEFASTRKKNIYKKKLKKK